MDKFEELFRVLNEWMYLHERGRCIDDIIAEKGISRIAIYGMGDCAIHLINELADTDIISSIIVDEKMEYDVSIPIVAVGEEIGDNDLIISTAPITDPERSKQLSEIYHCKVVPLAELVFEMI